MKTQISRDSHQPRQRYSAVFQQMGRMLTDADWNEFAILNRDRLAAALSDVIGSGTPRERGIVQQIDNGDGTVSHVLRWGVLYAEGVRAELQPRPDAVLADPAGLLFEYDQQADFPAAPPLPDGPYRLYADVWERPVTSLEDEMLRDAGLHGADTCSRTQTMAQIKWCGLDTDPCDPTINPPLGNAPLTLTLRQGSTDPDPCDPCADEIALHDEVGNYLFRLEVHQVEYADDGSARLVVLKWSVENAGEQYVIGAAPPGFSAPDWCYEFFHGAAQQYASEKHPGRHLAPGFAPARGELSAGYPDPVPAGYEHVRRWDGFCELEKNGADWLLITGNDRGVDLSTAIAAGDQGHVDEGPVVSLVLNTMTVLLELNDHDVLAGDFWLAPVRQAIHNSGDTLLNAVTPQGIRHHYLCLGTVDEGVFTPEPGALCKPFNFPPLTDLQADDVCYDNGVCEMPGVHTVQDALDHLCQERDLRWHNKHLHGWGIVCGLIVECGPDTRPGPDDNEARRRQIRLTHGYALDCEGNDLVLDQDQVIDLIAAVEAQREAGVDGLPPVEGSGSVCLRLERDEDGEPTVVVEPYDGLKPRFKDWFDGTLLMDFFNDCIVDLIEAFGAEFQFLDADEIAAVEAAEGSLVSAQRRELISFINLIWQLINPGNGRYIYLSYREHLILRDLYLRLRELLQSKTFCGMFQGEDFPPYPFIDRQATTWFGKGCHTRVLLHPNGGRLYSYAGGDNTINVYDVAAGELVEELAMPSGVGAVITALAVDDQNGWLYAAALSGVDTVFGRARIGNDGHEWDQTTVLCDLHLTALEVAQRDPGLLYAIGRLRGLYTLRPEILFDEVKPQLQPVYAFRAYSHLAVDHRRGEAYATVVDEQSGNGAYYNQLAVMALNDLPDGSAAPNRVFPILCEGGDIPCRGNDDLAIRPSDDRDEGMLFVVVDDPEVSDAKRVLGYRRPLDGDLPLPVEDETLEDTAIALAWHGPEQCLLVAAEDGYRLQSLTDDADVTKTWRIPVQIQPTDVVVDQRSGAVYTINFISNTITAIPANELAVDDAYLAQLEQYRRVVLEAFFGLAGNLLQYLKDCFCHHLLVKCPTCDEDDHIYLACVELRDNRVHRICNFDKRKYVHSFPTVEYWLSLVPVIPMIKGMISEWCCAVLPDWFEKQRAAWIPQAAMVEGQSNRLPAKKARGGLLKFTATPWRRLLERQLGKFKLWGQLGSDELIHERPLPGESDGGIEQQALNNAATEEALKALRQRQILVNVRDYDEAQAGDYLRRSLNTPDRILPGSRVNLYQRDGQVVLLTQVEAKVADDLPVQLRAELEKLDQHKRELSDLETLKAELAALKEEREAVSELAQLKAELSTLQDSRAEAGIAVREMRQQLSELRSGLQELQEVRSTLRRDIAGDRPVHSVSGVGPALDEALRVINIRTVKDLAEARPSALRDVDGIGTTQARRLIQAAKDQLTVQE